MTKVLTFFSTLLVAFALTAASASAKDEIFLKKRWDYALNGYDTVSYHKASGPVKGDPQFSTTHKGATWIFASQENLDAFNANPAAYRPAYGGYCAWALATGKGLQPGDPKAWAVHNGKLYVNLNKGIQKRWLKDKDGFIAKADPLWPSILNK